MPNDYLKLYIQPVLWNIKVTEEDCPLKHQSSNMLSCVNLKFNFQFNNPMSEAREKERRVLLLFNVLKD
jgi:hypothetical protein